MSRSCSIEIYSIVFLWYRFQIRYHDQIEQKSIKEGAKISKKSKSWIDLFFFKVWKIIVHDFENDACFWRKRRSLKVGQVVITISNKRKRDRETKLYILSTIIIKMIHKKSNKTSVLLLCLDRFFMNQSLAVSLTYFNSKSTLPSQNFLTF